MENSYAENEPSLKRKLVAEHLETIGMTAEHVRTSYLQHLFEILDKMQELDPPLNQNQIENMKNEATLFLNEALSDNKDLLDIMYPVYDEVFTLEELRTLINLDKDPSVRSILDKLPTIAEKHHQRGEALGRKINPIIRENIINRMKKEGLLIE